MTPRLRCTVTRLVLVGVLLSLGACAGGTNRKVSSGAFEQCVPFARQESGIQIRGDARTWWTQAENRYDRGARPSKGSVLVLKPDGRLPSGHVAVVSAIKNSREILVDHANWGWNDQTRGRIYRNMPAVDVSSANDWSAVRFKHPDVGDFGRQYPAYGFIHKNTSFAALP